MLTVADCVAHIDQVLASDLSSELSYQSLVNQAGEHLVQMHSWRWLERPAYWLQLRGNVSIQGATTNASPGTTLTSTGDFADYNWLEGDQFELLSGTGATPGHYRIVSATDDDLVLSPSPGASATNISGVVHADAVALPSDFYELIAHQAGQSLTNWLELTTLQHLSQLRTREIQVSSRHYYGAITYATPVAGGTPVLRMEIYPSVSANLTDELVIHYRAGWFSVTDDSSTLSIPTWMDTLYLQVLRAFAQGYEEYDEASLQQRLLMILQGPEFGLAKRRDGGIAPTYGPMRGGAAMASWSPRNDYLRTPVEGPS